MKRFFSLLMLVGVFFSSSVFAHAEPVCQSAETCKLGQQAEQAFFSAWANGDWSEFQSMLNKNDLVFQFPDGPFKGRASGKQGYQNITHWINHHIEVGNRIHRSVRNQRFAVGNWYYFADEAEGTFYGKPYQGSHMIGFKFNNGKIVEYREYVGDLTHWK